MKYYRSVVLVQALVNSSCSIPKTNETDDSGGLDTEDMVFLLSRDEVNRFFPDNSMRKCVPTVYARKNGAFIHKKEGFGWWWLRTAGNLKNVAIAVGVNGSFYNVFVGDRGGSVRPAIWIDLTSPQLVEIVRERRR